MIDAASVLSGSCVRASNTRRSDSIRPQLLGLYALLVVFNVGAWLAAFWLFNDRPALLGISALIYGLGLRHAVDADHIAAIDNVTRKLLQDNQRPVAVGFFFAMGHSTIVTIVAIAIGAAATLMSDFQSFRAIGGVISTIISSAFLLAIAAMNAVIFRSVWRTWRDVRRGAVYVDQDLDVMLGNRGPLVRILRPMLRLVSRSWHMFPLGFLFGLGFDTATEIAMFSLSATEAARGVPLSMLLVFPALFAAGMSLVDTTDGVMMLGAYEWAFVNPLRKLTYNMVITLVSAIVALCTGAIEALGLIGDKFGLTGIVWRVAADLMANFNRLGFVIIAVFAAAWTLSWLMFRTSRQQPSPADPKNQP